MAPVIANFANSNNNSGTTLAVTLPSGITAGQLLIIITGSYSDGEWPDTPSGWTLLGQSHGDIQDITVFGRIATGSEGSSVTISGYYDDESKTATAMRITGHSGDLDQAYVSWGFDGYTSPGTEVFTDDSLVVRALASYTQNTSTTFSWSGSTTAVADYYGGLAFSAYQHMSIRRETANTGTLADLTVTPGGGGGTSSTYATATIVIPPAGAEYGDGIHTRVCDGAGWWTVPEGVTSVTAKLIGAGGSGSGITSGSGSALRSGAAGGASAQRTFTVSQGQTINWEVGLPEPEGGSILPSQDGLAGRDSWFKSNDSNGCVAKGGSGATTSAAGTGSTTGCVGDTVYRGGHGATGSGSDSGAGGGGADPTGAGNDASGLTPGLPKGTYGGQGGPGTSTQQHGAFGQNYGGGGGGARRTSGSDAIYGGAGAQGVVIFEFEVVLDQTHNVSDTATLDVAEAGGLSAQVPVGESVGLDDGESVQPQGADSYDLTVDEQVPVFDRSVTDSNATISDSSATVQASAPDADDAVGLVSSDHGQAGTAVSGSDPVDIAVVEDGESIPATERFGSESVSASDEVDGPISVVAETDSVFDVAEDSQVIRTTYGADAAEIAATESAQVSVSVTEVHDVLWSDSSFRSSDGHLSWPRVAKVLPESRVLKVVAE